MKYLNKVKGLDKGDGHIVSDDNEVDCIANEYFMDLFTSKGLINFDHILTRVRRCIMDGMNKCLTTCCEMEEIATTLKAMAPTKASRIDGCPALFFQTY